MKYTELDDEARRLLANAQLPHFEHSNMEASQIRREPMVIAHLEAMNTALTHELDNLLIQARSIVNTFNEFQQSDEEQMHYFEKNLNRLDIVMQPYREMNKVF